MSAHCILGYALIPLDAEIPLEDTHVTVPRDLSVTDKRFVLTKMNAQSQMAAATKNARTIREVTAAPVDMASCYSQTGKRAKISTNVQNTPLFASITV